MVVWLTARERLVAVHENRLFQASVIAVIVLSALVIGVKTYEVQPAWLRVMTVLDTAVTAFFLVELLVRMAAERGGARVFFSKGWNVFDFLVVSVSLIPLEGSQMVLLGRLLRVFRVLRLISAIPELRLLTGALVKTIPRMGYVALLMFIIFYIYGALGSVIFEKVNGALWGDVAVSMLTLFRVVTFEDWTDIMYETMDVYPLSWFYYLSFIFLAAFVFLNMMIGVVVDVMHREHQSQVLSEMPGAEAIPQVPSFSLLEDRLSRIEEKLDRLGRHGVGADRSGPPGRGARH